jgi:hypothetical protein
MNILAWTMWSFYGLNYAFAYACFHDTSMGHYTWYLVPCNELSLARRSTDKPTLSRSQGRHAYPFMRAADIRACVLGGRRPPMAAALHPDIAHIIGRCWSQSATARPPFSLIIMLLEAVQQSLHDSADAVTNAGITTTIFRQ